MEKVLTGDYIHNLYKNIEVYSVIIIDDNGYSLTIDENTNGYSYIAILKFLNDSKPVIKNFSKNGKKMIIGVNKISF